MLSNVSHSLNDVLQGFLSAPRLVFVYKASSMILPKLSRIGGFSAIPNHLNFFQVRQWSFLPSISCATFVWCLVTLTSCATLVFNKAAPFFEARYFFAAKFRSNGNRFNVVSISSSLLGCTIQLVMVWRSSMPSRCHSASVFSMYLFTTRGTGLTKIPTHYHS